MHKVVNFTIEEVVGEEFRSKLVLAFQSSEPSENLLNLPTEQACRTFIRYFRDAPETL
jgi:hypothetical protein